MDAAQIFSSELAGFALALVAAGAVAGLIAGLLGVGGGIVIVPVLFHVFGLMGVDEAVRMHMVVGTSLAIIIPTSLSSVRSHHKRKAVDFAFVRRWTPGILGGVILGTFIASVAADDVLTAIFAVMAVALSVNMLVSKEEWRLGNDLPARPIQHAMAGVMGTVSALMGIGGGTLGVSIMTLYNMPIHRAVGTAAGLGVIISIPGAIGFVIAGWDIAGRPPFSFGYISLIGLALIIPTTILAAPIGAALAHRLKRKTLMRAFAVFLLITSARLFWSLAQ